MAETENAVGVAETEGPPQPSVTLLDVAVALRLSPGQLKEFARRPGKYLQHDAPKAKGNGTRHLQEPNARLMAALHQLDDWCESNPSRMPVHEAAHGFVRGRSIATHAATHANAAVLISVDLEDWFDTITVPRVEKSLKAVGWTSDAARVAARLCTYNDTLPQGAPTSPRVANCVARFLDRQLALLARRFGCRYTRYADDLTFSSVEGKGRSTVQRFLQQVEKVANGEGFRVKWKKVKVSRAWTRMEVAGLTVNPVPGFADVRVSRQFVRRVGAAIHNFSRGRAEWTREQIVSALSFVRMVNKHQGEKLKVKWERVLAGDYTAEARI